MHHIARAAFVAAMISASTAAMAGPAGIGLFCTDMWTIPWWARLEPVQPYRVYPITSELLNTRYCKSVSDDVVVGCTYSLDGGKSFVIVIDNSLRPDDERCVTAYEKAHVNCWGDKSFESPQALATFAAYCGAVWH